MRLTGMQIRDWEAWAKDMRRKVLRWTGIPVSIGISNSKTLAKVANHHSKRHAGFHNVLAILSETRREEALKRTKVGDIWGIGRQYEKFLKQHGIENALEFSRADLGFIRKYMTIVGGKDRARTQRLFRDRSRRTPATQKEHTHLKILWQPHLRPQPAGRSSLRICHALHRKTARTK